MFKGHERVRQRLLEVIDTFRQKGATSPDKAMTTEELGLPPRFEVLMHRRLGRLGVFVETNGKYYISEGGLRQFEAQRPAAQSAMNSRKKLYNLRIIKVITGILFITLLLVNIFVQSPETKLAVSILLVVSLGLSILRLYYLTRIGRRYFPLHAS